MRPNTTGGRPSTKSLALMLTSFIRLFVRNCKAVLMLLKKCGLRKTLPLSIGFISKLKVMKRRFVNNVKFVLFDKYLPAFHRRALRVTPAILCHLLNLRSNRILSTVELAT